MPTATPTPTPVPVTASSATLYVGTVGEVDAFPAGANGPTAPQRRITGFFRPRVRPDPTSSQAVAIGVGADRVLYVVKVTDGQGSGGSECALIAESPTANGTAGVLSTVACGVHGSGVTAPSGEVDVLTTLDTRTTGTAVQRFVNGSPTSHIPVTGLGNAIASGPTGNLFVAHDPGDAPTNGNMGRIDEYAPGASSGAAPVRTIGAPSGAFFGALAVAPNATLYAVYIVPNYSTGRSTETIYAFAPGSTTPSRALGPFTNDLIAGIAVDRAGELYVGSNDCCRYSGSRSRVDVYAPNANGNATPLRTLPNPIPGDASGGTSINALALSP
jgi:hypothetical protein